MILNFEDDLGKRHFEFVFVGFVLGGSLQEKKGMQILRQEVAIFEKLESISDVMPCGKKLVNGEVQRQLRNGDSSKQLQVSVQEYDLMHSYIAQVPWQSGTPAKYAVECLDWMAAAQRESQK